MKLDELDNKIRFKKLIEYMKDGISFNKFDDELLAKEFFLTLNKITFLKKLENFTYSYSSMILQGKKVKCESLMGLSGSSSKVSLPIIQGLTRLKIDYMDYLAENNGNKRFDEHTTKIFKELGLLYYVS